MKSKRFLSLSLSLLLIAVALSGCRTTSTDRPRVQSPQFISVKNPPLDPAADSLVTVAGDWCFLQYKAGPWNLCNIHYHRPAEHGRAFDGSTIPPCGGETGTKPEDWVELHYVYVTGRSEKTCDQLRERAFKTGLVTDCPPPFLVRAFWARVTPTGGFKPKENPLPESARYAEYDGSTTGDSNGAYPAYWKINRDCLEISEEALGDVHKDPWRKLQPNAPKPLRPRSTED